MKCTVTYDCWQMECCGTPFSVGDTVKWFVKAYDTVERERSDILSDSLKTYFDNWKTDYDYDAHSSDWKDILVLEGKVETIKILYHKYVPSVENPLIQIPVSGETVEVEHVEGFEKKLYDMMPSAYIVALSECTISRTNV